MFDPAKLLGGLLSNGLKGSGGLGGLSGGLGGIKGTVGLGLLGVAMEAFDHFTQKGPQGTGAALPGTPPPPPVGRMSAPVVVPPPPPGASAAFPLPPAPASESVPVAGMESGSTGAKHPGAERSAVLLIRAMIGAAAADGEIDAAERERIVARLEGTGISQEERQFLQREMAAPVGLEALVSAVASPELALQVYAASLMAITVDSPAEASYLARLAASLRLDPDRVAAIRAQLVPGKP